MSQGRGRWTEKIASRPLIVAGLAGTLILGAGVGVYAATAPGVGSGAGGCFDPKDFGAAPGDATSDRTGIQAAIDAATSAGRGTVCLSSGRWTVDRPPASAYDHAATLSTHGAHVTITGTGPGTVIALVGDQGNAAMSVFSLDPGASDVRIERLTIDMSGATNTDEQSHAIAIGSGVCTDANGTCSQPVSDISVNDVRFVHPHPTDGHRSGDCVRILGNTDKTRAQRVTIMGSSFIDCARSGIAVQRNVYSLAVIGNHFGEHIGDTAFDGEATGGSTDIDDGLRLEGNSFSDGTATASVSLTTYRHATITGNTFSKRGLSLYRTQDVVVSGNTFDVTAISDGGVIESENTADGNRIVDNVIRRHGTAGPAIRVIPHSGGVPKHVSITNNAIFLDGDSLGVYSESASDIGIRDNDVTFNDAAPNGAGIALRATGTDMQGVTVNGNTVESEGGATYDSAVRLAASPHSISGVTVALNSSRGAAHSLSCAATSPGTFTQPIVSLGNRWNVAPACTAATLTSGQ